jgi:methyl halide transferase
MAVEDRFSERYKEGTAPWDIGKADDNLVQFVTTLPIAPCKALDIGCGTGDNAIWLSQQNFSVIGVDASKIAIEKAREKAAQAHVTCTFAVLNVLKGHIDGAPFGFAFDRGCFHTMDSASERQRFAKQVNRHLEESGMWLSLIANADEKRPGPGPPQRSARDIVNAVEPYFEILSLVSGHFGSNVPDPPRAWVCLMRKRMKSGGDTNTLEVGEPGGTRTRDPMLKRHRVGRSRWKAFH